MSIVNILTPSEKRLLEEAFELFASKRDVECVQELQRHGGRPEAEGEEAAPVMEGEKKMVMMSNGAADVKECGEQTECEKTLGHSSERRRRSTTKPPDALTRLSQQTRQEYELWDNVWRSLEHPFVYRTDAQKDLCLTMLQRIPVFQTVPEDDLGVISSHMEIVRVGIGEIVVEKRPVSNTQRPLSPSAADSPAPASNAKCSAEMSASPDEQLSASQKEVRDSREQASSGSASACRYVFVLLRGKVLLRIPSLQSSLDAFVDLYELFAMPVTLDALPEDSRYEADVDSMLLRLKVGEDLALDRVIGRIEKQLIQSRVSFLQRQLRVRVLTHWRKEEFEACARALIPLRVSWRQVLVGEGEKSNAMYFIKEGNCAVVRGVPLLHLKQQQAFASQLQSATVSRHKTPMNRTGAIAAKSPAGTASSTSVPLSPPPPLQPSPAIRYVEVATLREGEFFGEVGLLNHYVDWKPDAENVWSKVYWQKTLDDALRMPIDFTAVEGEMSWMSSSSHRQKRNSSGTTNSNSSDDVFPPIPLPRQATVYTKCPSVLYMLTYAQCRQLFDNRVHAQIKEFSKGYPSCEDIENQYERQRKWARYRKVLVRDVRMDSSLAAQNQAKFPPLRFK